MKPFEFSLEKVRDFKKQMLDKEKTFLAVLQRRLEDIRTEIKELTDFLREKTEQLQEQQNSGAYMNEIASIRYIIEAAMQQKAELFELLIKAEETVKTQRQKVLSLSRELSGFDKLKEKKLEEYRYLESKEAQQDVLEHLITKISFEDQSI